MAKPGQKVSVRYCGTLAKNGKVFDETKGNKTFNFRLGEWPRPLFIKFMVWCPVSVSSGGSISLSDGRSLR